MLNSEYLKNVAGVFIGAFVAIPGIAFSFYLIYQVVTTLGN